jgi:hypothetical protein
VFTGLPKPATPITLSVLRVPISTERSWLSGGRFLLSVLLCTFPAAAFAQAGQAQEASPFSRWVDLQTATIYTRYRFIENSADRVTSNHLQYKQAVRARFNADAAKKITLNVGLFSGSSFISTWNNWGPGTGDFDGKNNYLKQLFVAAVPLRDVEIQAGGLYVRRGEDDDITTFDEDGYLVGERLTIRRPDRLFLNEITVTRASLGPFNEPNLWDRWQQWSSPNYAQFLIVKRLHRAVAASLDFSTQAGATTIRAAATVRLPRAAPVQTIKYEQYVRTNHHEAAGFAAWGERALGSKSRLQAGYATIDQYYGGWNADRIQSGRRFFALWNLTIGRGLGAQLFATEALSSSYPLPLKRRYEAVVSYDLLAELRRHGL